MLCCAVSCCCVRFSPVVLRCTPDSTKASENCWTMGRRRLSHGSCMKLRHSSTQHHSRCGQCVAGVLSTLQIRCTSVGALGRDGRQLSGTVYACAVVGNGREAAFARVMHEVTPLFNAASQQVWSVPCSCTPTLVASKALIIPWEIAASSSECIRMAACVHGCRWRS
jgi:hypothetical protein